MAVFLLLWTLMVVADGSQFRFDYNYMESAGGWFKFHEIPATWNEARVRCGLEGAVLASPLDRNVSAGMVAHMARAGLDPGSGIILGTHALFSRGDYYSIEGVPLSRMPVTWRPAEPNGCCGNDSCIAMDPSGYIGRVNCSAALPYLCYRPGRAVPLTECGTSDPEYKLFPKTGHCYKFHTQGRNWTSAFMACSAEGGYLAIPDDKEEAMYLKDLFKKNKDRAAPTTKFKDVMFLGFLDIEKNGVWTTIHGARLEDGYAVWAKNQPEGEDATTCGAMYPDGGLDDYKCWQPAPFVCEKTVDSLL